MQRKLSFMYLFKKKITIKSLSENIVENDAINFLISN